MNYSFNNDLKADICLYFSLESVMSFRADIIRRTSLNVFKTQTKPKSPAPIRKSKGREIFPQPFKREKLKDRRKNNRYKTLPITLVELGKIPELEPITPSTTPIGEIQHPLVGKKQAKQMMRKQVEEKRSKNVSDSDSDFDKLVEVNYRKLTQMPEPVVILKNSDGNGNNEESEDDKSKMSLIDKMRMFKDLEEQSRKAPLTPKSGRRFLDRKKRMERSRTQPVTDEELTKASEIAKKEQAQAEVQNQQTKTQVQSQDQSQQDQSLGLGQRSQMQMMFSASSENLFEPSDRVEPADRAQSEEQDLELDLASGGEEDELSKYVHLFYFNFLNSKVHILGHLCNCHFI